MKITADTNLLIRLAVNDDAEQVEYTRHVFDSANLIAISIHALCEFVWVLHRGYKRNYQEIALAIGTILHIEKIVVDKVTVERGLAALEAGIDFADGVIAYQGASLGAEHFISFDRHAVEILNKQGVSAFDPAAFLKKKKI